MKGGRKRGGQMQFIDCSVYQFAIFKIHVHSPYQFLIHSHCYDVQHGGRVSFMIHFTKS